MREPLEVVQRLNRPFAAQSDAVIGILVAIAKQERVRLSERTIAGLERAKAQGSVGGRPKVEDDAKTLKTYKTLKESGSQSERLRQQWESPLLPFKSWRLGISVIAGEGIVVG